MDFRQDVRSKKDSIRSKLQGMGWKQWGVLLLLGLLMAVLAMPTADRDKSGTSVFSENQDEPEEITKSELETKLEALLECVEGVGKVDVLLMTEEKKDVMGFSEGGEVKVNGVLIAAEGADNYVTVENIQQAVMALFQVEAHKIKVMKMK